MATAGYSGTPLPEKLGIREGDVVGLVAAPPELVRLLGDVKVCAISEVWSGQKAVWRKEHRAR